MKGLNWKTAALVGVLALALAFGAVALAVSGRDGEPEQILPDAVAPEVSLPPATPVPTPEPTPEPTERPAPDEVTLVGDSIMVAAQTELEKAIPDCVIDAK